MKGRDTIEFYIEGKKGHTAVVESSFAPSRGDVVVIRKVQYIVTGVQWCVDHADDWAQTSMRCTVDIVPHT